MSESTLKYGLLGRRLAHSWSPQIHARLGSTPYALVEKEPTEVAPLLRAGSWEGLNVTIPYKRQAATLADQLSPRVKALGVANTLVRQADGRILADNTDVLGFEAMLDEFCRNELGSNARTVLEGSKALVLGTGGAAQAVAYALRECVGATVAFVSRKGASTYDNLLDNHGDASLIVNTTPVGMFPNCPASPLDDGVLEQLPKLKGVLDVVYNPRRTGICLQAERAGLPYASGLAMLVWQAFFASELFQGKHLDQGVVSGLLKELYDSQTNIALIGMPGAGKTSTGRALARLLGRPFIDLDDAFYVETGMAAGAFINAYGEQAFRERESLVAGSYLARSGMVIACGGGIVTQRHNYELLHQNSTICFVDRPLHQLSSEGRPLSQRKGIERLASERMGLYIGWADVRISCTGSAAGDALLLKERLGL